ncbi:MAG: hypothetical protein JRI45_03825 [Deltaproteobacteria bacterium]|nr:hypothetical protein [Deltaproteobacteria bacterium]MBW2067926.1 hypothetical protein [Deltaproteobacteria bacterium]
MNSDEFVPCSVRIASVSDEDLEAIKELERRLGNKFCLVAVEKESSFYVVEAKLGPNHWERVDKVYPEIKGLRAYYTSEDDAKLAKSSLKSLLAGKMKGSLTKRPIRVRRIVAEDM